MVKKKERKRNARIVGVIGGLERGEVRMSRVFWFISIFFFFFESEEEGGKLKRKESDI